MATLRHRPRHLHATLVDYLRQGLRELDWEGPNVPYGATPITIVDHQPDERGTPVLANTVAISMGDEQADVEMELGAATGGLHSVLVPLFVDVYGEQGAISVAIASDVKQLLRHANLRLRDWSKPDAPPAPGMWIEIDEVLGPEFPQAAQQATEQFRKNWRVVKAATVTYFEDVD